MNRNDRDWPAVRTAAEARIKELGLTPGRHGCPV